jgi:hypothetical protein
VAYCPTVSVTFQQSLIFITAIIAGRLYLLPAFAHFLILREVVEVPAASVTTVGDGASSSSITYCYYGG